MGLRQFVGVLRARRRFFAVVLAVGIGSTTYLTLTEPPVYASSATLFVSTPPTSNGVTDAYAASLATQERTRSYVYLATDDEVLDESARRLGGLSATELEDRVSAEFVEATLLLKVEGRGSSPERAQEIAEVVADEMLEEIRKLETPDDGSTALPFIVSLASKASFDDSQVAPRVPLSLGTGLLLSLLAAIASTVLREVLDTTLTSSADIQASTGMSPLVTLPIDPKGFPVAADDPNAPSGEAFRLLRTNLQFTDVNVVRQVILVTSALPLEGKSYVAVRLAMAMARSGRSVLLLDADMRNAASWLDLDGTVGLGSVLLGTASIEEAIQTGVAGVDVMVTGPLPPNPAEVLETRAMRDLLATLRERYDVILVDAPPLLPVADAAILVRDVDGAILVTRYGVTQREQLTAAVARIQAVGGELIGAVLNGAPPGAMDGYGYGYGPIDVPANGKRSRKAPPKSSGRRVKR